MTSEIKVGDQTIKVTANAGTPYWFKWIFQEDLIRYISFINDDTKDTDDRASVSIDVAGKLLYTMAMQNRSQDNTQYTTQTFFKWLTQFETADIMSATTDIWRAYDTQSKTTSAEKKEDAQPTEK